MTTTTMIGGKQRQIADTVVEVVIGTGRAMRRGMGTVSLEVKAIWEKNRERVLVV